MVYDLVPKIFNSAHRALEYGKLLYKTAYYLLWSRYRPNLAGDLASPFPVCEALLPFSLNSNEAGIIRTMSYRWEAWRELTAQDSCLYGNDNNRLGLFKSYKQW